MTNTVSGCRGRFLRTVKNDGRPGALCRRMRFGADDWVEVIEKATDAREITALIMIQGIKCVHLKRNLEE